MDGLSGAMARIRGSVPASTGVAVLNAGEPFDALMERADAASYSAKRAGRHPVCVAPAA